MKWPFVIDSHAIDRERKRFVDTLEAVGPGAATDIVEWTALDIAAHVASHDRLRGVPTFLARMLVARGVRLGDLARRAPQLTERALTAEKRRGFELILARLRRPSPPLLIHPLVRTIGLFEVWAHHEDVRRPNGIDRHDHPPLEEVIAWLRR